MARGADSASEAGSDSSSDEIESPRAAPTNHEDANPMKVLATSARFLGEAFFKGTSGLPKDPARARYWLKKVVDGECEHKHLLSADIAKAAAMLRELDD